MSMARRKPMMGGMRGGMPMRGGPGMDRGGITLLVYKSRHQVPLKWNVLLYCEFVFCA